MWLLNVLGVPLFIVVSVFIFTSSKTIKKRFVRFGIFSLITFTLFVLVDPSIVGLRWIRTDWKNYEVPNEFEYTIKSGLFTESTRGIQLKSEEPVFVVENDYTYEIYTGDYLYEAYYIAEDVYKWYDAIGITVYEGNEIICKSIFPSIMDVDTLELVSESPITLRTSTDEMIYEYIIELEEMGTYKNGDESYYETLNERPERIFYIPYNQDWIDRSDIDEES